MKSIPDLAGANSGPGPARRRGYLGSLAGDFAGGRALHESRGVPGRGRGSPDRACTTTRREAACDAKDT